MEYLITNVTELNTKKSRVEINYDMEIALYKGELRRFHIKRDEFLSEEHYHEIMDEILPKRARERCLNLLARRSMTEKEIRRKLKEGFYPEEIIEYVIELLVRHRLINDEYYADSYVEYNCKVKSARQIKQELIHKGVDKETILCAMSECEINEEENIRKLMNKKRMNPQDATEEEKNKFCAYLLRKGYDYDKIRKVILI